MIMVMPPIVRPFAPAGNPLGLVCRRPAHALSVVAQVAGLPETAMAEHVDIVFDGPPGPESGRFIEAEDANGNSIRFGDGSSVLMGAGSYASRRPPRSPDKA